MLVQRGVVRRQIKSSTLAVRESIRCKLWDAVVVDERRNKHKHVENLMALTLQHEQADETSVWPSVIIITCRLGITTHYANAEISRLATRTLMLARTVHRTNGAQRNDLVQHAVQARLNTQTTSTQGYIQSAKFKLQVPVLEFSQTNSHQLVSNDISSFHNGHSLKFLILVNVNGNPAAVKSTKWAMSENLVRKAGQKINKAINEAA